MSRIPKDDNALLDQLRTAHERERANRALLLAHLAELDARRLYLQYGYPSMLAYCIGELNLDEDEIEEELEVARIAHAHPALFEAIAECRLDYASIRAMSLHLTSENADEMIAAARNLEAPDLLAMLADRFPRAARRRKRPATRS